MTKNYFTSSSFSIFQAMRAELKKILPQGGLITKLYRKAYWWVTYKRRGYPMLWKNDLLEAYASYKKDVRFIQIGSNNGVDGDPICRYIKTKGWRGILVEPVPHLFNELKCNYHSHKDNLHFENSAISNESGTLKFYRFKNLPENPQWYSQLGSFNKEVILKHKEGIPQFDELLIEDEVKAITFKDLLQHYSVKDLNLVHIDTEGHDYEILKLIPFIELNIEFIMFEHVHLKIHDYKNALKLLKSNGYKVGRSGKMDTIAIKKNVLREISFTK